MMGLFSKRKEEMKSCCGNEETAVKMSADVKVLGSGCCKCNELEEAVAAALKELNIAADIDHVTDFGKIASYGVMTTPALVVNGKVLCSGRVLKKEEAKELIRSFLQ